MMSVALLVVALVVVVVVSVPAVAVAVAAAGGGVAPFPPDLFKHVQFLPGANGSTTGVRLLSYFFEATAPSGGVSSSSSSSSPAPLVLYLSGGPGCSDSMSLFLECGPYAVNPDLSLSPRPYPWTEPFSMLFLDNPRGTGYSDVGTAGYATSEAEITADLHAALEAFFDMYPEQRAAPFFIAGESYAGHYIPPLAQRILDANADAAAVRAVGSKEEGLQPQPQTKTTKINLQGIAMGNAMVDPITQVDAFAPFAYGTSLLDSEQAAGLQAQADKIKALIQAGRYKDANSAWDQLTVTFLTEAGWPDPSDIRHYGFAALNFSAVTDFMTLPAVQAALGVPAGSNFSLCQNQPVAEALAGDEMRSTKPVVEALLTRGLPVLIFEGNFDPTLPLPELWIKTMKWPGQHAYASAKRKVWGPISPDGFPQTRGYVKQGGGLTFTVVALAGHMAAMDQPQHVRQMMVDFVKATTTQ